MKNRIFHIVLLLVLIHFLAFDTAMAFQKPGFKRANAVPSEVSLCQPDQFELSRELIAQKMNSKTKKIETLTLQEELASSLSAENNEGVLYFNNKTAANGFLTITLIEKLSGKITQSSSFKFKSNEKIKLGDLKNYAPSDLLKPTLLQFSVATPANSCDKKVDLYEKD